jgi:excisionase family DNA binding protein
MANYELITVKQAAVRLGVSCAAIYKGLGAGRLAYQLVGGRRMLRSEGLEQRWHGSSQRRRVIPPAPEPGPDWAAIAEAANAYLDASWGPPPWPADRWATLAMVASLASEVVAGV